VTDCIRKVRSKPICRLQANHWTDAEVETTCEGTVHPYCCAAHNSGRNHQSDCHSIISGSFERVFSRALGQNRIPLADIPTSQSHRRALCSLSLAERQQLKGTIESEYHYIERTLTLARLDKTMIREEREIAIDLAHSTLIHQLPVELIIDIFSFIPDGQTEKFAPLAQTCRRWKEITSLIWSPVELATWSSLDGARSVLDGGVGMVSITIDPSRDAMDRPTGALETERYAALMLAVSTSISRWRTLDILSLPDPQHANHFFGEQSNTIGPVPMNHLRSLSIPIRHDSSQFLDRLLPSIGATTSVHLTDMHLCSVQATLFLAQPQYSHVFHYLTSFGCFLPRTDSVIDILPQFRELETLEVSGLHFPTYAADIELPLTKTLRQMSLKGVPIDWMNHREFLRLQSCTIVSPRTSDVIPIVILPLCRKLDFEGPRFDTLREFRIPTISSLTLRSPQWSKGRGNVQLSHLWGAVPREGSLRPTSLHLHLTCSSKQLLQALCFMPELRVLVLGLDHPSALGKHFFNGLLPRSSPDQQTYESKGKLRACPSLEQLGLTYRRWFRPGELNELHALVALAYRIGGPDYQAQVWVEKGVLDQEIIRIYRRQISTSDLCSLGLLQLIDGMEPTYKVVNQVIETFLAVLDSVPWFSYFAKTLEHIPSSLYPCLFQHKREMSFRSIDIDQRAPLEALSHCDHLERLYVGGLSLSSSQYHLPLLRTLKSLHLGTASLLWMGGCTFIKLEEFKIGEIIAKEDHGQFQHVQIPMCKSASFPHSVSSQLLSAFEMPQLRHLHLHNRFNFPIVRILGVSQSRQNPAGFINFVGLRGALEMLPALETLEISEMIFPWKLGEGFIELLDVLVEHRILTGFNDLDHSHDGMTPPGQDMLLCPKLKVLKLVLVLDMTLALDLEHRFIDVSMEREARLRWERKLERMQQQQQQQQWELESELGYRWTKYHKSPTFRRFKKFMNQRREKYCPMRSCQITWGSPYNPRHTEIVDDLFQSPWLDMPDKELSALGDIFSSLGSQSAGTPQ
jgi:hypothetical protein